MKRSWNQRQGVRGRGLSTDVLRRTVRGAWLSAALFLLCALGELIHGAPPWMLVGFPLLAGHAASTATYYAGQLEERGRHQIVYPDADPGIPFERTPG